MSKMNRRLSATRPVQAFALGLVFSTVVSTSSAQSPDIVAAINSLHSDTGSWLSGTNTLLNNLVSFTSTSVGYIVQQIKDFAQYDLASETAHDAAEANILFQASPDSSAASNFYQMVGETIFVNQNQVNLTSQLLSTSSQAYLNAMSDSTKGVFPSIVYGKRAFANTQQMAQALPLSDSDVQNNAQNYNFDTYMGTNLYPDDTTKNNAINYVNTLAGLGTNFSQGYNEKTLKKLLAANDPSGLAYLAKMGSYAAAQSVGLSTLYDMIASRTVQPTIKNLNIVDKQGNKVQSAAQLEQYMAERRALSPEWYNTMAAASPATVSRETLYLLAEMRLQQYRQQVQQERLLAIMAAMHLAGTQNLSGMAVAAKQANLQSASGAYVNAHD